MKEEIINTYKFRIELHTHTSPASSCGHLLPSELVEIYHAEKVDALCIANHFFKSNAIFEGLSNKDAVDIYLKDYYDALSAAEKYGMKVYLAAEMRFTENINDYLLYGTDGDFLLECFDSLNGTMEEFRKKYKLENSVFIQAHPFRDKIELADPKLIDGIEIINAHPGHNNRNGCAARYAKENNIRIKTCGSDFHYDRYEYRSIALIRTKALPNDSFELAKILKSGDYVIEYGKDNIILP